MKIMKMMRGGIALFVLSMLLTVFFQTKAMAWSCDGCHGDCETIIEIDGYGLCAPNPECCCCAATDVLEGWCSDIDDESDLNLCLQDIYAGAWFCGLPLPNPLFPASIEATQSVLEGIAAQCGPEESELPPEEETEEEKLVPEAEAISYEKIRDWIIDLIAKLDGEDGEGTVLTWINGVLQLNQGGGD